MLELEGQGFIADMQTPSRSWLEEYIYSDDRPQVMAAIKQAIAKKMIFELEHRVRRVDGSLGWTLSRAVPLFDADGEIVEWFGAATDITERVQAENTRQLLLGELNHRVKNTLANVCAIAQQTLRHTRDPADFASRFSGRIQTLSRVHSLLTDRTWRGAGLHELIRDQVMQGPVDEARLAASGPAVHLDPQTVVLLASMRHERGKLGQVRCAFVERRARSSRLVGQGRCPASTMGRAWRPHRRETDQARLRYRPYRAKREECGRQRRDVVRD